MIVNVLIQILSGLAGIILLTLLYFFVSFFAGAYALETNEIGEFSVYSFNGSNSLILNPEKKYRARILCNCIPPSVKQRYKTAGYPDCSTLNMFYNGNLSCMYGCLGLGSCAKLCTNNSIVLQKGSVYISESCTGCGICVPVCPKKLISLISLEDDSKKSCAADGQIDATSFCRTAEKGYLPDFTNFPE